MKRAMTITYPYHNNVYVNMTNRCNCACRFCLRKNGDSIYDSDPLWLEREPTVEEVCESLAKWDLENKGEVVFCGYGEPTERLEDMLKVAEWLKANYSIPVRVNTNGLGDLLHNKRTAPLYEGRIDTVSVSLNATNAEAYQEICRTQYGLRAYDAMLKFTEDCTRYVPNVVMTVVDEVTTLEEQARAKIVAESVGAKLRIRPLEK